MRIQTLTELPVIIPLAGLSFLNLQLKEGGNF